MPPLDTVIRLAGRTWRMEGIDERQRTIIVARTKGKAKTRWTGDGGGIHDRVVQRVRQVLAEDTVYPYLQEGAKARLNEARDLARSAGILEGVVHPLSSGATVLLPWVGSRTYRGMRVLLGTRVGWGNVSTAGAPLFLTVKLSPQLLKDNLRRPVTLQEVRENPPVTEIPRGAKHDPFFPDVLLRDCYLSDNLELVCASSVLADV